MIPGYPLIIFAVAVAVLAGIFLLAKPGPGPCDSYRTQPELQALCVVGVETSRR